MPLLHQQTVQLSGGTGQRQIKNICGEESMAAVIGQTTASCTARTNGGTGDI